MKTDYRDEIKEIELDQKAIQELKAKSDKIEKKRERKEIEELKKNSELDMVPTREKGSKVPKKYQLKDHPIFFKGSKIESRIPKAPSLTGSGKKTQSFKRLPRPNTAKDTKQVSFRPGQADPLRSDQ